MSTTITALKLSSKASNEVLVFLEGRRQLRLLKASVRYLKVNQELTEAEINALKERDQLERLFLRSVRLVGRRPRSEKEIRDRFSRENVPLEIQDRLIARLTDSRMLDDYAFAKEWIENRQTFRPRSAWALTFELRKKGIAEETIEKALVGFDERHAVLKAARLGARKYRHLSEELFRKRLSAYMSRRGFRYPQYSPVVEEIWGEITGMQDEREGLT
jgi:regulatory protein